MDALNLVPDLVQLFAAVGGFATLYGAVKVGRTFVAKWKAARDSKTATEDRLAAVETALRDFATVLGERNKPATPVDQAKGAVG